MLNLVRIPNRQKHRYLPALSIAPDRLTTILLTLLSGTSLAGCGGGGGGGGGGPTVAAPPPGNAPETAPDKETQDGDPSAPSGAPPLPTKINPGQPVRTLQTSSPPPSKAEKLVVTEPSLRLTENRGSVEETIGTKVTASRSLASIIIENVDMATHRPVLSSQASQWFELKPPDRAGGHWSLWLKAGKTFPDPGQQYIADITVVDITVVSSANEKIQNLSGSFVLSVSNIPEAPTVRVISDQSNVIFETGQNGSSISQETGIRLRTADGDGDGVTVIIERRTAGGDWVADDRFEIIYNKVQLRAGQTFDFDAADNPNGVLTLRARPVDNSSERLSGTPVEFVLQLTERAPVPDPVQSDEALSSNANLHHRIFENNPLDKPVLDFGSIRNIPMHEWTLADGFGDNHLFRLHSGKLFFANSANGKWNVLDYENPADLDKNNVYQLKLQATTDSGEVLVRRLDLMVHNLINENMKIGHARIKANNENTIVQQIISDGVWLVPTSGPLVLKWAINVAGQLVRNAIAGNNPPTSIDVKHTDGKVYLATLVNNIRSEMSAAVREIEAKVNIKFVEVQYDPNNIPDLAIDVLDQIGRPAKQGNPQAVGRVKHFPYFGFLDKQRDPDSIDMGFILKTAVARGKYWLEYTLRHELGHALGLKHPWDEFYGRPYQPLPAGKEAFKFKRSFKNTIMGYESLQQWSDKDIEALQYLYGLAGGSALTTIIGQLGVRPAQETAIFDRKPTLFAFLDSNFNIKMAKKSVAFVKVGSDDLSLFRVVILDDGYGQNKVDLGPLSATFVQAWSGFGSFEKSDIYLSTKGINFSETPVEHDIALNASGTGPAPPPLTLSLVTYELVGTKSVGETISVRVGSESSFTVSWLLVVAQDVIVPVATGAAFTPIEPGQYQLRLTLGDIKTSTAFDIQAGVAGKYIHRFYPNHKGEYSSKGAMHSVEEIFILPGKSFLRADDSPEITEFQWQQEGDKVGFGYGVEEVWVAADRGWIYFLDGPNADARYLGRLRFSFRSREEEPQELHRLEDFKAENLFAMGQAKNVAMSNYEHDIRTKNKLYHWVVDRLDSDDLIILGGAFKRSPFATQRDYLLKNNFVIDLGEARAVWFDVMDVNNDGNRDTVLYKTADRSQIYGVINNYNGRVDTPFAKSLDGDFFVNSTIAIHDLDVVQSTAIPDII